MTDLTTFSILHVCTGNICRSPMAERLTRVGLDARLGSDAGVFTVSSAGTWGHSGSSMEPFARSVLAELKVSDGGFRARELSRHHIASADLILTATREHRGHVMSLDETALRRTFTVREFSRLVSLPDSTGVRAHADGQSLADAAREIVRVAAARRGQARAKVPSDDDVADPYGAPQEVYRACAATVTGALNPILDVLTRTQSVGHAQNPDGEPG